MEGQESFFEQVTYKLSSKDEYELKSEREKLSGRGQDRHKDPMLRMSVAC